jgi:hemerythrin-like domain-containing protein
VCGHCGCQAVDAIGELRDEHAALTDAADAVRSALATGDRAAAAEHLSRLLPDLARHVAREERGLFTALREQGDFAKEVEALEDVAIAALDPHGIEFGARVLGLLGELDQHIEREDLGVFPVSVVTLGASGWATVDRAHADLPTFLDERSPV